MRCSILHESVGRMRVRLMQGHMTMEEAELLERYLRRISCVTHAKVNERTADAVVKYCVLSVDGKELSQNRDQIIQAFSAFSYENERLEQGRSEVSCTARQIQREYENRMTALLLKRAVQKLFLPVSVRDVLTVIKAVPYLWKGIRTLAERKLEVPVLDAASILVSLLRGETDTAGSVMFLLGVGDLMEEWTHRKSVEDLAGVMALNVDKVWLRTEGQEILVPIDQVHIGDEIVVREGNLIPLDGEVTDGEAMINQASITGEPLAVNKRQGGYVYAGSVVEEGELLICVKQEQGTGRYDRIVAMIEESEKLKSDAETKASALADRLVPWTLGATALTWLLTQNAARAASILMVDFCCALKLSMPIAVLSGMREAGNYHISVKGGKFMEACARAQTICFDKTGTLTVASPRIYEVVAFGGQDPQEMLRLAACLEEHFPHSLANAVVNEARERGLDHEEKHSKVEYVVAHGISSSIDGQRVCLGSYHFLFEDEGCRVRPDEQERFDRLPEEYTHLYLSIDGKLAAVILIEDPLKEEAASMVEALYGIGIDKVVMMTGDGARTAHAVAAKVGIDTYFAEVLPEDKANFIRQEHEAGRKVIMVGDGINDSPALSEADVGVAMNSGAAIAREIADVMIAEDDLWSLIVLRRLSMRLMQRINTNYNMILSFNSLLMLAGAFGLLPAATTALLHNTSTIAIGLHNMTNLLDPKGEMRP